MAARTAVNTARKSVKPIFSTDKHEARRRVLNLYKAWYRQIPYIVFDFHLPKNEDQCREKLKEMFVKHRDVKDIRAIDMLVIKGQMELKETVEFWKQTCHLMTYFNETVEPKPTDFLSKFINGQE